MAGAYRETQGPALWVWLVLVFLGGYPLAVLLLGDPMWSMVLPLLLCALLVLLFIPLGTTLENGRLRVAFGLTSLIAWNFKLADVETAEAVTYRPLKTYLGWGIRRGFDRSLALTMRGNRGVMLTMRDGKRVLVGSRKPEELARALQV